MMLYPDSAYESSYCDSHLQYASNETFSMLLNSSFSETTILPNIDMNQISEGSTSQYLDQPAQELRYQGDVYQTQQYISNFDAYPSGNRDYSRLLAAPEHLYEWTLKPVREWSSIDVRNWILDTGTTENLKIAQIPSFHFANMTGQDLILMSKEAFCDRMKTESNAYDSPSIGEIFYRTLEVRLNGDASYEQEAVVPVTVMDKFNADENLHINTIESERQLLDMDSNYNTSAITESTNEMSFISNFNTAESDYADSLRDEYEMMNSDSLDYRDAHIEESSTSQVIGKRLPGRPKGSGKKQTKRVKNVSVPEFLRDLLHNPKYCPKIIKWEDYSEGKFRFVKADEVAKLWGAKRNNGKMSFEKFSRAMRYHYKQKVLLSVPTARLVYKFGPKAPAYATENPNFETLCLPMDSR